MKRFSLLLASCATVLFFLPNIALSQSRSSDAMIFVKAGCTGSGTSWSDAVGDLSAAVQIVSENGGTVYIGDGTYTLTSTLSVPVGVALVGDKSVNVPIVTISGDGGILTLEEGTADRYASVAGITVRGATAGRGITAHAYARIVDCIIENNTVTAKDSGEADTYAADGNSGAGLWLGANTLLERSIVRGNTNAYIVGGVSIPSNNVTIKNCLIADNMSNGSMTGKGNSVGGLLIWHNLSLVGIRIINTTVASNVGKSIGGAWMDASSKSEWINCVTWGNCKTDGSTSQLSVKNTHKFTNFFSSQKSGVITVTKVLNATNSHDDGPKFTSPETGDYTLAPESPLVDAGSDKEYGDGLKSDLCLGNTARLQGASIDVGAYERQITTAIGSVVGNDNNSAPEYYDLRGIRVADENLRHGELYIMRAGDKVRKVFY